MHHQVFVAGTFDGLHKGHQAVLTRAFAEGERVTVGVTTDQFKLNQLNQSDQYSNKKLATFEERRRRIVDWLKGKEWLDRATIIAIADKYEPAASDESLDAIIVTSQNRAVGEEINTIRVSRSLKPLVLIDVPLVSSQDGQPISSTRMRNGAIDASGRLILPDNLRPELAKPLGKLLTASAIETTLTYVTEVRGRPVITVGDVVTKTFLDKGITPTLAIIDLRVGRAVFNDLFDFSQKGIHVQSGPGFISKEAIAVIRERMETLQKNSRLSLEDKEVIVVDGEEDLLVLPVVLAAPLGSLVYYGQPHEGIVKVVVTREKKEEATQLLNQFTN